MRLEEIKVTESPGGNEIYVGEMLVGKFVPSFQGNEASSILSAMLHQLTKEDGFKLFWEVRQQVHAAQMQKVGFSEKPFDISEFLMLVVSELSEALEYARNGNGQSNHIPEFLGIEEELADVVLRIMHGAARNNWHLPDAIVAKMKFNQTRPFKHGDKEF